MAVALGRDACIQMTVARGRDACDQMIIARSDAYLATMRVLSVDKPARRQTLVVHAHQSHGPESGSHV
jgi:hypothetical protein